MPDIFANPAAGLQFDLEAFDGPLDLLLYLIKKDEVDIYDIPIAEITRQYLAYLEACRELSLEVAGEFLYMAAMLIRIKSQMLLPQPGETEEWEDPRTELVNALLEYKKIKKIAIELEALAENQSKRHIRLENIDKEFPTPEPELMRVDLTSLMIAFGEIIRRAPKDITYSIVAQEITVDMRKKHIMILFGDKDAVLFEELFLDDPRRIVMVVTFVALLELVKSGILRVEQATRFSQIRIMKRQSEMILLAEEEII